jgi:hypothetical protein
VALRVPQAGVQLLFAIERSHLTPWLPEAPETEAVRVTGAAPIAMVAKLPLTLTTIPELEEEPEEELQAAHQNRTNRHRTAAIIRFFIDPLVAKDFRSVDFGTRIKLRIKQIM